MTDEGLQKLLKLAELGDKFRIALQSDHEDESEGEGEGEEEEEEEGEGQGDDEGARKEGGGEGERGVGENEEGEGEGGDSCEGIKVASGDSRLQPSDLRQEGTIIGKRKREDNGEDDGESGERGMEDVDQGEGGRAVTVTGASLESRGASLEAL